MEHKGRAAAAAAMVLGLLAGCGGGSVGVGIGTGRTLNVVDPNVDRAVLAIQLFDSLAGAERLLAASNGYTVIEGPAGVDATTACAGGGSIRVHKVSATVADLAPTNCRLRSDDPLVYGGAWRFTITSTSFPANGVCAPGATCSLVATIDVANALYGYGTPTDQVIGTRYQSTVTAAGQRNASVTAANEVLAAFNAPVLSGTLSNLTLRLPGAVDWQVSGDVARQALQVSSPFGASITLGSNVTAAIDENRDGTVDRTVTFPWSELAR